jgi:UDP-GlcNAc3NAcA epimerase
LYLLKHCNIVITDSGGLQKEAYWMKKKCITIRTETEWVETLAGNANTLTGPDKLKILQAYKDQSEIEWDNKLYGEGNASEKIASILKEIL